MTYTLTAERGDETDEVEIDAEDSFAATMQAIAHVLDTACEDQEGLWAKGRIVLTDEHGDVLHEMEEKP
jgi:hypothetical protein